MGKVFVVTLGFCPARILLATLEQVYSTIGVEVEHHLLNNHYPNRKITNDPIVEAVCKAYGIKYHDLGENVGLSAGYNYLITHLRAEPTDVIIGLDPDNFPAKKGWGEALVNVISHPDIAWASLQNANSVHELPRRGYTECTIGGVRAWLSHHACTNSICAWRYETIKALGGLQEPKKYYGGIECQMFPMVASMGKHWAYLPDFEEIRTPLVESEPDYQTYKREYAHNNSTQDDFETWLKLRS